MTTHDPNEKVWPTLAEYVHQQNGVPLGAPGSLRNMLSRSLGAQSFAEFWRYWNPIWGYGLKRFVYAPLRRLLPPSIAVIATFAVSGALHDIAASIVRRTPTFLITPWFFLLGIGMLVGQLMGLDMSGRPWAIRATVNLAYLGVSLFAVLRLANAWSEPGTR